VTSTATTYVPVLGPVIAYWIPRPVPVEEALSATAGVVQLVASDGPELDPCRTSASTSTTTMTTRLMTVRREWIPVRRVVSRTESRTRRRRSWLDCTSSW